MNELEQVRTPELIGAEIRMYVDAGRRVTLLCGIEIGRRLNEAKELLKHGEWLPWLEKETEFSERQAQRYMKVFNEYGAAQLGLFGPETNATSLSDLPISKALALLSVPESEREQFAEEVGAEDLSTRELEKLIQEKKEAEERAEALAQERDSARKELQTTTARLEDTQKALAHSMETESELTQKLSQAKKDFLEADEVAEKTEKELKARIHELENRPIKVAVERDEKAIEEAVQQAKAAASAEWAEKVKKLQEDLEKANAQKDKLKAKADKATAGADEKIAAAEQETARIRQELEAAQKKLKASDGKVAAFGVYFKSVQENFNSMMEKVREIGEEDPETSKKLCGAARVILQKAIERLGTEE